MLWRWTRLWENRPQVKKKYMNILILKIYFLYANERFTQLYSNKLKCINFTKYKTKDKSLSFLLHRGFVSNVYKWAKGDFLWAKLRCEYIPLKIGQVIVMKTINSNKKLINTDGWREMIASRYNENSVIL